MNARIVIAVILIAMPLAAFAQNQSVDPIYPGDLVYLGPNASSLCALVGFVSNPCHVGMFMGNDLVTEVTSATSGSAVHSLSLPAFQVTDYRSSMTSYPHAPSSAARDTMTAYELAKQARATYYDTNHLNQKGGYDHGCGSGVVSCWDGWDYYNEFDCVGLTERAYEIAAAPDVEGLTPNTNPGNGCTYEGVLFIYPSDQYASCKATYAQAFPPVGSPVSETVKHGYWHFYTINIGSGVTSISATTTSATDVDLYIGFLGYVPDFGYTACQSAGNTGSEQCSISSPSAGVWVFGVYGYANGTSSYTITITQGGAPNAQTKPATSIAATSATLNGAVTANGLSTTTAFDYGTTNAYGQSVSAQAASGTAPTPVSASIGSLTCNTLYHFRVNATNSAGPVNGADATFRSGNCPIAFTDDPLVTHATRVKAIHLIELRNGINALRTGAGLTAITWLESIAAGGRVKASHILELRSALDATRVLLGLQVLSYANPIVTGGTIRAADINEIRNALR